MKSPRALRPQATLNFDAAPPSFFAASNYLNIGERPFQCCSDNNNDSLDITITGNWSARVLVHRRRRTGQWSREHHVLRQ